MQRNDDILSHSDDPHDSYAEESESLPAGSVNSRNDKINLRKFVATFTAMNML